MPNMTKGLFFNAQSKPTTYYSWAAALPTAHPEYVESRHIRFPNPPYEVGLWTLLIKTTDSGGGTPTITPTLYFGIDGNGTYYDDTAITLNDIHGSSNTTFTSGATFVARLDTLSKWCFSNGFKIRLARNSNDALIINYAEVVGI